MNLSRTLVLRVYYIVISLLFYLIFCFRYLLILMSVSCQATKVANQFSTFIWMCMRWICLGVDPFGLRSLATSRVTDECSVSFKNKVGMLLYEDTISRVLYFPHKILWKPLNSWLIWWNLPVYKSRTKALRTSSLCQGLRNCALLFWDGIGRF